MPNLFLSEVEKLVEDHYFSDAQKYPVQIVQNKEGELTCFFVNKNKKITFLPIHLYSSNASQRSDGTFLTPVGMPLDKIIWKLNIAGLEVFYDKSIISAWEEVSSKLVNESITESLYHVRLALSCNPTPEDSPTRFIFQDIKVITRTSVGAVNYIKNLDKNQDVADKKLTDFFGKAAYSKVYGRIRFATAEEIGLLENTSYGCLERLQEFIKLEELPPLPDELIKDPSVKLYLESNRMGFYTAILHALQTGEGN